jgi:hypothetical protein
MQVGGLNVTITSQVVVYAPAERAEKLLLFLLYPYLLCDANLRKKTHIGIQKNRAVLFLSDLLPYWNTVMLYNSSYKM